MKNTRDILSILRLSLPFAVSILFTTQSVWGETITSKAQLPTFYSGLDDKSGTALVTALKDVCNVSTFSADSYATVWTNFATTDVYPSDSTDKAGKLWDMYSNVLWTSGTNKCGNYSGVGTCYNREHSMPKSWFGVSGSNPPAGPGTDMHHMYPTDGQVNNQRSNYPFGECSGGTRLKTGSYYGTGKLGTSTLSGYTSVGTVWEPDDQYKGDFARTYMYMLMKWCAKDNSTYSFTQDGTYGKKTFNNTFTSADNYGLTAYGVALLMKWHRQDPVSRKEIDRNNAVQSVQGNRNPFIDYPCLAEYLWGNKKDETFKLEDVVGSFDDSFTQGVSDGCACSTDPVIKQPSSDVDCGATETNVEIVKTITIQGDNLTSDLSFAVSGINSSYFTLSTSSMTQANATAGKTINIKYKPTSAGNHSATLTISGGGLTSPYTVTLTGTCCTPYSITLSRNGVTETLSVCGTYTLPTADDEADACDGWEFKGWLASNTSFTEGTTTAPTFVTSVSSTKTLHAVYGQSSGGGSTRYVYEKVKSTPSNWAGTYLIVYKNGNVAFDGGRTTFDGTGNTISVTIANDTIPSNSTTDAANFTIAAVTGGYSIKGASGKYIGVGSYNNGLTTNTEAVVNGLAMDGENAVITVSTSGGTMTLRYNSASDQLRFRYFKSGQQDIQLYKRTSVSSGGIITYKKYPCTNYTITLSGGGSATNGSFEASAANAIAGTTIYLEADPEECYQLSTWTVTKAGGGSVSVTDNQFIMPEANVTVSANFSEMPDVTVTFLNNGVSYATRSGCEGSLFADVSDPTPCDGYDFVGWSTSQATTETTTSPTIDYTGTIPSTNSTYYAVYSRTEAGSGSGGSTTITEPFVSTSPYVSLTDWSASAGGIYDKAASCGAAVPSLKLSSTGHYVQSATLSGSITSVSYYYKAQSATGSINFFVSTDGSTFTELTTARVSLSNSSDGQTKSITLSESSGYKAIKITYTKTTSNVAIDDVSITYTTSSSATYYTTSPSCAATTYTITWKDGDGNTLKTEEVAVGSTPSYTGTTPTKTATAQYTYTFNNTWTPTIVAASQDATYMAQFSSTLRQYNILWKNEDGTSTLETDANQNYGTATAFNGSTPTKAATAQYTYTFDGWATEANGAKVYNNGSTPTVSGTATYYAHFSSTVNSYSVTFKDNFGTTLKTQTVNYGGAATAPSIPEINCYTHGTWDKAYNNITGDLTVTVTYTIIPYTITATSDDDTRGTVAVTAL